MHATVTSDRLRYRLYAVQDGTCFYCLCRTTLDGSTGANNKFTIDHVVPRVRIRRDRSRRHRSVHLFNIVGACASCNRLKGDQRLVKFVGSREFRVHWIYRQRAMQVPMPVVAATLPTPLTLRLRLRLVSRELKRFGPLAKRRAQPAYTRSYTAGSSPAGPTNIELSGEYARLF